MIKTSLGLIYINLEMKHLMSGDVPPSGLIFQTLKRHFQQKDTSHVNLRWKTWIFIGFQITTTWRGQMQFIIRSFPQITAKDFWSAQWSLSSVTDSESLSAAHSRRTETYFYANGVDECAVMGCRFWVHPDGSPEFEPFCELSYNYIFCCPWCANGGWCAATLCWSWHFCSWSASKRCRPLPRQLTSIFAKFSA